MNVFILSDYKCEVFSLFFPLPTFIAHTNISLSAYQFLFLSLFVYVCICLPPLSCSPSPPSHYPNLPSPRIPSTRYLIHTRIRSLFLHAGWRIVPTPNPFSEPNTACVGGWGGGRRLPLTRLATSLAGADHKHQQPC